MDTDSVEVEKPANSDRLSVYLEELLNEKKTDEALAVVKNAANHGKVYTDCSDIITAVVKYFTDRNLAQNPKLHSGCEEILKAVANVADVGEVILELLEVIDSTKNDNTVVSVLKALQICLLRRNDRHARSLEWCLNSIQSYACELPLSPDLRHRLDSDEEQFLEEEDQVRRIVSFYFYLFLFYEPILDQILVNDTQNENNNTFRDNSLTRRNALTAFIIQLFGEPFACLDLSVPNADSEKEKIVLTHTNVYTRQCVQSLVQHLLKLMSNPLQLIPYGERRLRWPYILPAEDDSLNALPPSDIFLVEEKAPITALSIMFYALFAENLLPENTPKIYRSIYLFEMGLYYASELLSKSEESLRMKGIRLATKLLDNLQNECLNDDTLDLDIHKIFVTNLVNVLDTTQVRRNSKLGVELLQKYVTKFKSIDAKFFHVRRLLITTENNKIRSFLITMYKNIIADQLNEMNDESKMEIATCCRGEELRSLLLNQICTMPDGIETDILKHHDVIMAALNLLRFLIIRDANNYTQLWNHIEEIDEKFLKILRDALDCSRAHYRLEEKRIQEKKSHDDVECEVEIADAGENYMSMSTENRLQALSIGQNTFDLIDSLLSRLNECIESRNQSNE